VRLPDAASDEAGMKKIFISYQVADSKLAVALASTLERIGYGTWYFERDGEIGETFHITIYNAIVNCDVFLILISNQSLFSSQVILELRRAQLLNKKIYPLLYGVNDAEYKQKNREFDQIISTSNSSPVTLETVYDVAKKIAKSLTQASPKDESPTPRAPSLRPHVTGCSRAQEGAACVAEADPEIEPQPALSLFANTRISSNRPDVSSLPGERNQQNDIRYARTKVFFARLIVMFGAMFFVGWSVWRIGRGFGDEETYEIVKLFLSMASAALGLPIIIAVALYSDARSR
jgi:hypothetical protein